MTAALVIAAPASGSGKTVVTLAILRHLNRRGRRVASFKVGPDYIDPGFHRRASGAPCYNLDPWAMRAATRRAIVGHAAAADFALVEGVMGLFDGATADAGSTADIAAEFGWPVILVVDVGAQASSAAALVRGFLTHRADVEIAGIVLNRVGGPGHVRTLKAALAPLGLPVLGAIPPDPRLTVPSRHLGLVLAEEHGDLDAFLDGAANAIAAHVEIDALVALGRPLPAPSPAPAPLIPALGRRIAIARDAAFAFVYPHLEAAWRAEGAALVPFSPLADQAPEPAADAVFLPGGYPELHAVRLARSRTFLDGLRTAVAHGATVYGECGGYMVLGETLVARDGSSHVMAGLLPLATSFAAPALRIGHRRLISTVASALGPRGSRFRGHEFHYAQVVSQGDAAPLFVARDAEGENEASLGLVKGTAMGSFAHLVDSAEFAPD